MKFVLCMKLFYYLYDFLIRINMFNLFFILFYYDSNCLQEILERKGYIYKGQYEGWYFVFDEEFFSEEEVCDQKLEFGEI